MKQTSPLFQRERMKPQLNRPYLSQSMKITSESGPQRGSQVMLWVSVVVAIGVVAYGLGF